MSLEASNEIHHLHFIPPACKLSASTVAPHSVWSISDHLAARWPRYQRASAVVKAPHRPIPSLERLTTTHLPCDRLLLGIVVEARKQLHSPYLSARAHQFRDHGKLEYGEGSDLHTDFFTAGHDPHNPTRAWRGDVPESQDPILPLHCSHGSIIT